MEMRLKSELESYACVTYYYYYYLFVYHTTKIQKEKQTNPSTEERNYKTTENENYCQLILFIHCTEIVDINTKQLKRDIHRDHPGPVDRGRRGKLRNISRYRFRGTLRYVIPFRIWYGQECSRQSTIYS